MSSIGTARCMKAGDEKRVDLLAVDFGAELSILGDEASAGLPCRPRGDAAALGDEAAAGLLLRKPSGDAAVWMRDARPRRDERRTGPTCWDDDNGQLGLG